MTKVRSVRTAALSALFMSLLGVLAVQQGIHGRLAAQVFLPQHIDITIDNQDTGNGFALTGPWLPKPYRYTGAVNGTVNLGKVRSNIGASWTFQNLASGRYEVFLAWTPHAVFASNVTVSIQNGLSNTVSRIDQRKAPSRLMDGMRWESRGIFDVQNGTLVVSISDKNVGGYYLVADAARVIRKDVPPLSSSSSWSSQGDEIGYRCERYGCQQCFVSMGGGCQSITLEQCRGSCGSSSSSHSDWNCAMNPDRCGSSSSSNARTGNLYITTDPPPIPPQQLLAGTLEDPILRLNFAATDEPVEVTRVRFVADGALQSVDKLELYRIGEKSAFAIATRGSECGDTGFCFYNQAQTLTIQPNKRHTILVRPRLKTDAEGAVSGEKINIFVRDVEAIGSKSSNTLKPNDGNGVAEGEIFIGTSMPGPNTNIRSDTHTVVLSKVISITNANPDANGSPIPMGIAPIAQFAFTVAENNNTKNGRNPVWLDGLIFTVNVTNVAIKKESFRLYNKANPTVKISCTVLEENSRTILPTVIGRFYAHCSKDGVKEFKINPGEKSTFVLEAEITDPNMSASQRSRLLVALDRFNDPEQTNYAPTGSHIGWTDVEVREGEPRLFTWVEYPESVVNSVVYEGKPTECGNGIKEAGEDCDDGNQINGDGCNQCKMLELQTGRCGDGWRQTLIDDGAKRRTPEAMIDYMKSIDLDVDADGKAEALTDGILIKRHYFGFRGRELIDGAVGKNATRTTPEAIASFVAAQNAAYDVDDNGRFENFYDIRLIERFLAGFSGTALTGEQCDDKNTVDGDACSATCTVGPLERAFTAIDGNADGKLTVHEALVAMFKLGRAWGTNDATLDVDGSGEVGTSDYAFFSRLSSILLGQRGVE